MEIIYPLFAFVLMISIIVVIHEWGHYAAGRMFGLIGTHFSLGFGPKLFGWTDRKGTEWRFAPILLGGYVRFPGDEKDFVLKPGQKTLGTLPRWQRAVVVGAGPAINLVLAAVLFSVIAGFWGYPVGRPVVQTIQAGSPAATAGIKPGDTITAIDGNRVVVASDITQNVILRPGDVVPVSYSRGESQLSTSLKIGEREFRDDDGNPAKIGFLGVTLPTEFRKASNPVEALTQGVADGMFMTWAQLETMKQVVTGRRSVMEMSGPVRIAKMSARTLSLGFMPFLYLMAMISIAVGVMNLLPIPGLDGGHLATYAVEGVLNKDLPEKAAQRMMKIGLTIVACMGVFALTLDYIALT